MFSKVFCTDVIIMQYAWTVLACIVISAFVFLTASVCRNMYNDAVTNTKAEVTLQAKLPVHNDYIISPSNL